MPTEDETRQLLAEAAATIAVDETTPMTLTGLPEPRPRRWPVLAAAAAVVVAMGGGYVVAQQLGQEGPAPAIDPSPVGDDDQLPSLIGFTEDEAIRLLQERGYPVEVQVVPDGCDVPGIVTGTSPAAGARVGPGDPVTLRVVGEQDVIDCVGEVPWQPIWDLVRAARGLEEEAPASLRDAGIAPADLEAIGRMVAQPRPAEGQPSLTARWNVDGGSGICHDQEAGSKWDLQVWIEVPVDGVFCPPIVALVQYDRGRILDVTVSELAADTVDEETLEANLDRLSAAMQFVTWARGEGAAPEFADRVRVMYGGGPAFGSTGWTDDPDDRASYAGCSGAAFPDCGVDPVGLLVRNEGRVVPSSGRSTCADGGVVPKRFAEAPQDVVRLEEPESASCRNAWAVELWIDVEGVIYGVNQAGG